MKDKTKEKYERWAESLPLHHIDTSVILENPKTINGRFCTKYLQRVGYKYRGVLSLPVLGELFLRIILLKNDSDSII